MKYSVLGNVITMDINEDFTLYAIVSNNKETNKVTYTLYLQENGVNILDLIDECENIELNCELKQSFYELSQKVSQLNKSNFFDYYMARYKFLMDCADKGVDMIEGNK